MKIILILGSIHGMLAVALGAFGAHQLKSSLASTKDAVVRLAWWDTASHYQLAHALVLLALAALLPHVPRLHRRLTMIAYVFAVGTFVFSGTLYIMTITAARWLGAVTPIGGSLLISAWAMLVWTGWQLNDT